MSHWETSGQSDEWYTPAFVFDALGCAFDLDVAHPVNGATHVPCRDWLFADSLSKVWTGFVWMNPPFGGRNSLAPWLNKFFDHGNGIALTPDRTSAPWFHEAWQRADLVLFTRKIRFLRPDGSEGRSPSNGSALWAAGERGQAALIRAARAGLGILAMPLIQPLHTGPRAGTCGRGVYLQPDASVTFSQALDDAGAQRTDALSFAPVSPFHDNRFSPEAQYDGM